MKTRFVLSALGLAIAVCAAAYFFRDMAPSRQEVAQTSSWIETLTDAAETNFEPPDRAWILDLPSDHGVHEATRSESWLLNAVLKDSNGTNFGFQFSMTRLGLQSEGVESASVWQVRHLYRGHVTYFNGTSRASVSEERVRRQYPDLVGYDAESETLRLDNWVLQFPTGENDENMIIEASVRNDASIRLSMLPEKPTLTPPDGATMPFVGYALPRLKVEGTIEDDKASRSVTGNAWFDHVWGELPLPGSGPVARDRLHLHLDDGTDLSLIRTRRTNGRGPDLIDGFFVQPNGEMVSIGEGDIQIETSLFWQDPETDIAYPVNWDISGPDLSISVKPFSETHSSEFEFPIRNAFVKAEGRLDGRPLKGVGSMQLTGYARR